MTQIKKTTTSNQTTKIVVYDSSRGFSRFLKSKLDEQFEVKIISNKQEIKKYKATDFGVLLFIVNDVVDAILFSNLDFSTEPVFLGIAAKNLEKLFLKYENVITVDLELPKKQLFHYINKHLQTHQNK